MLYESHWKYYSKRSVYKLYEREIFECRKLDIKNVKQKIQFLLSIGALSEALNDVGRILWENNSGGIKGKDP